MSVLQEPAVNAALIGAIVAGLLYIQSYFQERRRRIETAKARHEQAEVTSTKVVEKLVDAATTRNSPITPLPPIEERVTPKESPSAKEQP